MNISIDFQFQSENLGQHRFIEISSKNTVYLDIHLGIPPSWAMIIDLDRTTGALLRPEIHSLVDFFSRYHIMRSKTLNDCLLQTFSCSGTGTTHFLC